MSVRLTPSLAPSRNDTGRTAFCGPTVLSAITGFPVSRIEAIVHEQRADPAEARRIIEGTYPEEVASALAVFGYGMDETECYTHLERKQRPTVWSWMQRPRSAFAYYILMVHTRSEMHWICIHGAKICDTHTEGRWVFGADGPHRGAKMTNVYRVRKLDEKAIGLELTPKSSGIPGARAVPGLAAWHASARSSQPIASRSFNF